MKLYVVTDENIKDERLLLAKCDAALRGGARWLQFRDKGSSQETLVRVGGKLLALCRTYGAIFIVNDHPLLAKTLGADGVHIGRNDGDVRTARALVGDGAIVGVSCYNDLNLAIAAERDGADYVAFGSFYTSPTKPQARRASLDLLRAAKASLTIPVCCIGGITPANAGELAKNGADVIALCSAVFSSADPKSTVELLRDIMRNNPMSPVPSMNL